MNQLNKIIAPSKNAFQSMGEIYCLFLLVIMKYRYHKNENISETKFIACSFLFIIVKDIIGMKIFLEQIYCLFLFGFNSKKLEKNV